MNGLGERAGNAALEEVVMGLKCACGIDPGIDTSRFREICSYVGAVSGRPVPSWKAVVGEKVFSHESGIHADGVLKDPRTYEGFDPGEVGLTRHLVIGKHSGAAGLTERYRRMGIVVSPTDANRLLAKARVTAQRRKRPLTDTELLHNYSCLSAAGLMAAGVNNPDKAVIP